MVLWFVGDSYGEMPLSGLWLASSDDPGLTSIGARSEGYYEQRIVKMSV